MAVQLSEDGPVFRAVIVLRHIDTLEVKTEYYGVFTQASHAKAHATRLRKTYSSHYHYRTYEVLETYIERTSSSWERV